MYRVAQEQLFHPRYTALRGVLYSYAAEGGLTGKQLLAVTEVHKADWVEEGVDWWVCRNATRTEVVVRSCLFL